MKIVVRRHEHGLGIVWVGGRELISASQRLESLATVGGADGKHFQTEPSWQPRRISHHPGEHRVVVPGGEARRRFAPPRSPQQLVPGQSEARITRDGLAEAVGGELPLSAAHQLLRNEVGFERERRRRSIILQRAAPRLVAGDALFRQPGRQAVHH